ncbi:MAG: antibiotic biosynthesis monooxygenase family protein [Actinomycetales bacterium]
MQSLVRFRIAQPDVADFLDQAEQGLEVLRRQDGCVEARLAQNLDEPDLFVLATGWADVGSYRRAMSAYEVKLVVHPLLYRCLDEPTAYSDVLCATPEGVQRLTSDVTWAP